MNCCDALCLQLRAIGGAKNANRWESIGSSRGAGAMTLAWILLFCVGLPFLGAYILIGDARLKAWKAYQSDLAQLKESPANADLRQSALALGRAYVNRMRHYKGRTTFDEVALMNDINVACTAT